MTNLLKPHYAAVSLLVSCGGLGQAHADVSLPPLFSAHAVLQKSDKTPVWGKAAPDEEVTVEIDGAKASAKADTSGKWRADLDLSKSGPGPFELKVTATGRNSLVIPDVVVGEVWLCSGQSNMEYQLDSTTGAREEIAVSANPLLREFRVEKMAVNAPAEDCKGSWVVASPATTPHFSAVAYYFGKRVSGELKEPVGLINSSWGGTAIEAWLSRNALAKDAELKPRAEEILREQGSYSERLADFRRSYKSWAKENQREDKPAPVQDEKLFAAPDADESTWHKITLPGSLASQGLPDSGAVWLRRKLSVTSDQINQGIFALFLATPRDFDQIYVNGVRIGQTTDSETTSINSNTSSTLDRRYDVPKSVVKSGENVVAIRLFSPGGNAGISPGYFCAIWSIPLAGEWLAKAEYELPPLTAAAKAGYPHCPLTPPIAH